MSAYAYMVGKDEKASEAFIRLGISEENIFAEEGKNGAAYKRMVKLLKEGDVLYVQSLDAFGMNMGEILKQWRNLTKDMDVDIVVVSSPLIDTRIGKAVNGSLVGDVVAEILSYEAHGRHERQKMRQKEGIERAKQRGVHCGRSSKPLPENFEEMREMWERGEITATEAAKRCGMPVSTFRYKAKKKQ